MAIGLPREEMLASWNDETFTTAPPEELRAATDEDLAALFGARPEELVEGADFGEVASAAKSKFGYVDESHKLYVGREFPSVEHFADWWSVQRFGSLPFNGHGWHHTAIPDRHQWIGLQHLHNTFHYYRTQLGWPAGKGPHIWLRSRRAGKVAGPRIYVGTHPAHDGIGISYRNHRYVHTEFIDRFDSYGYDKDDYDLAAAVIKIIHSYRGIPYKHCDGAGFDGPSRPMSGWLFHRRSKTNPKTCPGSKVVEGPFEAEIKKRVSGTQPAPAPKPSPAPQPPQPAPAPAPAETLYRVFYGGKQRGAYKTKEYALNEVSKGIETSEEVRITRSGKA